MSSLKRLENLEKKIPRRPCKHEKSPGVACVHDEASAREVERIKAVLESCPQCRKEAKLMVFILNRAANHGDILETSTSKALIQ